ncbi:hypothetical protein Cme02nite_65260 [Catellatospora methionotrophica]|uniref:Uncharacterized protein n=1 Tax=Catellatospora methionotrophica TaxID=121620 RepID=A0A8J3LG34_9ACTN|nr:hypothetical protein Cme02nite_65260 [Catellatospora methionotrophica]
MTERQTTDFAVKPTLAGERVVLRPFTDADLDGIRAALSDPEVIRLTGSSAVEKDAGEREKALRRWYGTATGGGRLVRRRRAAGRVRRG